MRLEAVFMVLATLVATPASAQDVIDEPPPAPRVEQPQSREVDNRIRRLDLWLAYSRDDGKRARRLGGGTAIASSAILIGIGTALYLDDTPSNELNRGIGISTLAIGGTFLAGGIAALSVKSDTELRYRRWRKALAKGMSPVEFARFEGELRSTLKSGSRARQAARWTNFGLVVSGALILGLTPAANLSSDGETVGYITGGILAGVGALNFGLSFLKSKDLWQQYESGAAPAGAERGASGWFASPTLLRKGGGAALTGRF